MAELVGQNDRHQADLNDIRQQIAQLGTQPKTRSVPHVERPDPAKYLKVIRCEIGRIQQTPEGFSR